MATVAARGSGTPATTGTTWASVTNAVDGTAGTNPATYSTMTNATASAVATMEVTGYGFSTSIASVDTLNSVSVSLRHFENNTGRFASVTFQAFDGATAIGTATTCTLATGARTDVATPAVTLAQLRSSTFKIRVTITGAASTQSRIFSIDQVDVTADYTPLPPAITQAAYGFYTDGTETGSTAYPAPTATLADSYAAANQDNAETVGVGNMAGQSFLGNGQPLARVGFRLSRSALLPGNVTAYLYAHTGTFGTSGTATGSPLATSTTTLSYSSLTQTTTPDAWYYFDFDGTYTLTNATPYVLVVGGDFANTVYVATDNSSPTHAGSRSQYNGTTWSANTLRDAIFEVYTNSYIADTSSGDVNLQVRVRLQSTNAAPPPSTDDWQLQWELNTSGTWNNVNVSPSLIDVYDETNANAQNTITGVGELYGQSFLGNGRPLSRLNVYVFRSGTVSGNVEARLYAHTGTFGSTSLGTGSPLATSTPRAATSLGTTAAWESFTFDGTYTLANGTAYVIGITTDTLQSSGQINNRYDNSAPTHAGCEAYRSSGGTWTTIPGSDLIFQVDAPIASTAVGYASANLTDAAVTTNRLGAGSGSFVAGEISETGLVTDLGWSANNYTELLYSVTLKQADLTPTDTLRFRVLRNSATTGLTYTQTPTITIGTAGPTDRTGTATGAVTLSGSSSGQKDVTGTGSSSLTVAGSASGSAAAAPVLGTATGSVTLSGVAAGVRPMAGTAAGALAVAGVASGQKTVGATATSSLTLAGAAAGQVTVTATATGALTLSGVSTGVRGTPATATGAVTVTGSAVGSGVAAPVLGTATGALTVTGTAAGVRAAAGTAVGAVTLSGTATGTRGATGTATSSLTLSGTSSGIKTVTATGTGQVVATGHALGLVEGNAVGFATGTVTVTGTASGTRATTGAATGYVALAGSAVGSGVTVGIQGQWNTQQVIAMQWGTEEVVDWFMLIPTATATGTVTLSGSSTGTVTPGAVYTDVLLEPFNNYTTNSWTTAGTASIVTGRTGTAAQSTGSSANKATWTIPAINESDTITIGFAWRRTDAVVTQRNLVQLYSDTGVTQHNRLAYAPATTTLLFQRGSTTLAQNAAITFTTNTWYYIELQVKLGDSPNGTATVRINGTNAINATGLDTKNAGTKTTFDTVSLDCSAGSTVGQWDDLYITTGAGAPFKGDITV